MSSLKKIFAYNLKEKRKKCGFTQAQLAEKVDVTMHHIGIIEIGRSYPTFDLVERIANVLNIEIYELFVNPLSTEVEIDRLYKTVANDINNLVSKSVKEAVRETLTKEFKNKKYE